MRALSSADISPFSLPVGVNEPRAILYGVDSLRGGKPVGTNYNPYGSGKIHV